MKLTESFIDCPGCNRNRKYHANGLCNTCNSRVWSKKDPDRFNAVKRKSLKRRRNLNTNKTRLLLNDYRKSMLWEQRIRDNRSTERRERRTNLSIEFLRNLRKTSPTCQCCSRELVYESLPRNALRGSSATLDRIIPHLGYIPTNVAIICHKCNTRKSDSGLEDLVMIVAYIKKASNK